MTDLFPEQAIPEPRLTVIEPTSTSRFGDLREFAEFRELLYTLALRDIKIRYKQTLIGATWAIIQPLLTMVVFTVVFSRIAHVSSGTKPYAVLVFVGLLPWQLFAQSVTRSTTSLVTNTPLISKIYFPRLIIPVAALGSPLFDFVISLGVLAALMAAYGVSPSWGLVALPGFLVLTLLASLGAGLWFSALNARFRDVGYAIPFILQLGIYISPVAYPLSAVPHHLRLIFELNPIADLIQGFRWGLIGDAPPDGLMLTVAAVTILVVLGSGLLYFGRTQRTFADVI
jgi:lipopolysaccharide transport system permease protein